MSVLILESAADAALKKLIKKFLQLTNEGINLVDAVNEVTQDILNIFDAERVTVYRRDKQTGEMVSSVKFAGKSHEIRLLSSTTSIAGFCALSRQVINVEDVYDASTLAKIHPKLMFQGFFDLAYGFRTKSTLVVPIFFNGALLGVMQVINRRKTGMFGLHEIDIAKNLATVLGEKIRRELQSTLSPYAYLVHAGRVSQNEFDNILARSAKENKTVSFLLMQEMQIDAAEIGNSLELFHQIPFMPYDPAIVIPEDLVRSISKSYLHHCGWLPVKGDRNAVTILIDDPADCVKISEILRLINAQTYHFRIGLPEDLLRYLGQDPISVPAATPNSDEAGSTGAASSAVAVTDKINEEAFHLVERLLSAARIDRASDIHIQPSGGDLPTMVRFRVDGICLLKEAFPRQLHQAVISHCKELANGNPFTRNNTPDGTLRSRPDDHGLEFAVASVPTVNGESLVIRLLTPGSRIMKIEELHLTQHHEEMLRKILAQPHGLFLVAGPANSGKTTALHSILDQINTTNRNTWTVEEQVEITHNGVQQVQIDPKEKFTFAVALQSVLMCDPDTIMVEKMRDADTAKICIEASLSGHLVLSTLFSNSASDTLTRLMDLGVEKPSLADALLGVMYQRLVRKLCDNCKKPVPITPLIRDELSFLYGDGFDNECGKYLSNAGSLFRHGSCVDCQSTGFCGRMAIHELLVISPPLKRLIANGDLFEKSSSSERSFDVGTIMQDRIVKAFQGYFDIDEILGAL